MRLRAALLAIGWGVALGASPGHAATATISAVADTYLRSGGANANEGTQTFLRVRGGPTRSLVRFDQAAIASAVGGQSLISARLELYPVSVGSWGSSGRQVNVHRMGATWTELGATWNCPHDTNTSNSQPDCPMQWNGGIFVATPTPRRTSRPTRWSASTSPWTSPRTSPPFSSARPTSAG
jgi:hypothetical protein